MPNLYDNLETGLKNPANNIEPFRQYKFTNQYFTTGQVILQGYGFSELHTTKFKQKQLTVPKWFRKMFGIKTETLDIRDISYAR